MLWPSVLGATLKAFGVVLEHEALEQGAGDGPLVGVEHQNIGDAVQRRLGMVPS